MLSSHKWRRRSDEVTRVVRNIEGLVQRLDVTNAEMRPVGRISRGVKALIVVFALAYLLGCMTALEELARAFQHGHWDDPQWSQFVTQDVLALAMVGLQFGTVLIRVTRSVSERQLMAGVLALRRITSMQNDTLAPTATQLLSNLQEPPIPVPARLGPFVRPASLEASEYSEAGAFMLFLGLAVAVAGVVVVVVIQSLQGWLAFWLATIFALAGLAVAVWGFSYLRRATKLRRRFFLTVDELGITWIPTTTNTETLLTWDTIQAFYTIIFGIIPTGIQHFVFVVDAGDNFLAWDVITRAPYEMLKASDRLCIQVLSHTSVVLRDLSVTASKLAAAPWEEEYTSVLGQVPERNSVEPTIDLEPPTTLRRALRPALILLIASILAPALFYLVGLSLPGH